MNETKKDNLACGAVLATMLLTMACGAFVVSFEPDSPVHLAHGSTEADHE